MPSCVCGLVARHLHDLPCVGPSVETAGFLAFFSGGVGVCWARAHRHEPGPGDCAFGAVSAVTGAYLVLFPRTTVRILFIVFFSFYDIPATWFIAAAVILDFLRLGDGGQIAHGVILTGFVVAGLCSPRGSSLCEPMYDLVSIWQHRKRR